jgi:hypothetical protein
MLCNDQGGKQLEIEPRRQKCPSSKNQKNQGLAFISHFLVHKRPFRNKAIKIPAPFTTAHGLQRGGCSVISDARRDQRVSHPVCVSSTWNYSCSAVSQSRRRRLVAPRRRTCLLQTKICRRAMTNWRARINGNFSLRCLLKREATVIFRERCITQIIPSALVTRWAAAWAN